MRCDVVSYSRSLAIMWIAAWQALCLQQQQQQQWAA